MPRHRLSLPPGDWPPALRDRLEAAIADKKPDQRNRLRQGFGRWLKLARDAGAAPDVVDAGVWARRAEGLAPEARRAMRQALGFVWPATLDVTQASRIGERLRRAPDARTRRSAEIDRIVARLPEPWRGAAAPLVVVGESPLDDGDLHAAWRPGTIVRRLETLARHLDFCSYAGLPRAVTPASVRAALDDATAPVRRSHRRRGGKKTSKQPSMRPGGLAAEITALLGAVRAFMPTRDWGWLADAERSITERAKAYGARNESRIVDVADLRHAGLSLMAKARAAHMAAPGLRERLRAHGRARDGLMMIILSEAPLRIGSIASLQLVASLSADLRRLVVAADDTKERREDVRHLSADLVKALSQYIALHRPLLAQPGEAALIVDRWGKRATAETLSIAFGKAALRTFGRPVNPHAIRTSVATFILATAPEEAALASLILHHRDPCTTHAYQATADQIAASRRLEAAVEATARTLAPAPPKPRRSEASPRPPRSLRLELVGRRGR